MNWKFWQRKPEPALIKWDGYLPSLTPEPASNVTVVETPPASVPEPEPTPVDPGRMKPEIRARWIEYLLSKRFKQGSGFLRRRRPHQKTEFCCLGVLCELAVDDGIISPAVKIYDPYAEFGDATYEYAGFSRVPSDVVADWAGLTSSNPMVTTADGRRSTLAELNDEGMPWEEIAALIDAQL